MKVDFEFYNQSGESLTVSEALFTMADGSYVHLRKANGDWVRISIKEFQCFDSESEFLENRRNTWDRNRPILKLQN